MNNSHFAGSDNGENIEPGKLKREATMIKKLPIIPQGKVLTNGDINGRKDKVKLNANCDQHRNGGPSSNGTTLCNEVDFVEYGLFKVNLVEYGLCKMNFVKYGLCNMNFLEYRLCKYGLCKMNFVEYGLCKMNFVEYGLCKVNFVEYGLCEVNFLEYRLCKVNFVEYGLCKVNSAKNNLTDEDDYKIDNQEQEEEKEQKRRERKLRKREEEQEEILEVGADGKMRLKKKKFDLQDLDNETLRKLGIDPSLSNVEIAKRLKALFGDQIQITDGGRIIGTKHVDDFDSDMDDDMLADQEDLDLSTLCLFTQHMV
ncbi:hypothetical protein KUTeg_020100 [Tegillarca granosa]|uniref:Uncharacterized protein n=1 Tax=Tegillarca granosa TaxID=220873 RepID=A0ABQ9E6T5_TEGGR|nr:hypothetical protein KUTeg_020100 [Tegillarca granosa]